MSTEAKNGSKGQRSGKSSSERPSPGDSGTADWHLSETSVMSRHTAETSSTRMYSGKKSEDPLGLSDEPGQTPGSAGKDSLTSSRSGESGSKSGRSVESGSTSKRSGESGSSRKRTGEPGATARRTEKASSTSRRSGESSSPRRRRRSESSSKRRHSGESSSTRKRSSKAISTSRRSSEQGSTRTQPVEPTSSGTRSGKASLSSTQRGESSSTSKRSGSASSTTRQPVDTSPTSDRSSKASSTTGQPVESSSTGKRRSKASLSSSHSGESSSKSKRIRKSSSSSKRDGESSSTSKRTGKATLTKKRSGDTSPTTKRTDETSSSSKDSDKTRSKRKRRRSREANTTGEHPLVSGLDALGLHSLVVAYKMAQTAVRLLANSPVVLTMPLVLLLASTLTDYLILLNPSNSSTLVFFSATPVPVEDIRRVDAEAIKKNFQAVLYLITLALCVVHWRAVKSYALKWPHLGVLIAVLLFSTTYSVEPTKVITNSILILVSILMPLLFVIGQKNGQGWLQSCYLLVFFPLFISHMASLLMLFTYGTHPFEIIFSTRRYGGFSGNPNSLGNAAALGLWAASALVLSSGVSRYWRLLAMLAIPLFMLSIAMSGSGTATVAGVLIIGLMLWMRILANFTPTVRLVFNVLSALVFVFLILSVLLMVTPAELFVVFTGSIGKDASMTGRTDLWAIAKDAIAQRPLLGWSFDSHASVMAEREYEVRYNHYHNGFLDTMIEGGMLLMVVVLYNFGWYIARFLQLFRQNEHVYPLIVPIILIVVLNMSEYSLLRPLSVVWQLYITCFVILSYKYINNPVRRKPTTKDNSNKKRGRRKRKRMVLSWG